MLELLVDALTDTLKVLPFLYVTYLAMEYLEHRFAGKSRTVIEKAGRLGPLFGGLLGVAPQCGFSAAAAGLYAGRVITLGSLLAVFLSTSDEMLPILLTRGAQAAEILKILALKAAIGMAAGFLIDAVSRRRRPKEEADITGLCHDAHCQCESHGPFRAALHHTLEIALYLLLFSFVIGLALDWIGEATLARALQGRPVLAVCLSALIGLIPNCGASVAITTLYLDGLLSFGAMMAGLLVGAGTGLLVLFRVNRRPRENLAIVLLLYALGAVCGGILELIF